MSGGAKNLFVYNNSFIGTDIGLRFKTMRGRGGVVEKVYIANTYMKDIAAEAVLFDMYYMAKDPVPLMGDKTEAPKIVLLPVTEETPQFKDFYINNVVVSGAGKGIFIRGLPEMNIQNINLENLTIQSKVGVEISEATNVNIRNLNFITTSSNPLIAINNSKNINFTNIKPLADFKSLFKISGEKTSGINLSGTPVSSVKEKTTYEFGAESKALTVK